MTRLTWNPLEAEPVKLGLDQGVLYFRSYPVQVWNGLRHVVEEKDGDLSHIYYDGQKVMQVRTPDAYSAQAEAYTYPDALESGDMFDLSYRVTLDQGYELHIVYNVRARFRDESWDSLSNNIAGTLFLWDLASVPVQIDDIRASAHLVINSNHADPEALALIENTIYGTNTSDPIMLSLEQILAIFEAHAIFVVVDHGDGTWTATGPDDWFEMLDSTTFQIDVPYEVAHYLDASTYTLRTW